MICPKCHDKDVKVMTQPDKGFPRFPLLWGLGIMVFCTAVVLFGNILIPSTMRSFGIAVPILAALLGMVLAYGSLRFFGRPLITSKYTCRACTHSWSESTFADS